MMLVMVVTLGPEKLEGLSARSYYIKAVTFLSFCAQFSFSRFLSDEKLFVSLSISSYESFYEQPSSFK